MVEAVMKDEGEDEGGDPACWAHLQGDPVHLPTSELLARVPIDLADAVIICDTDGRITFWNSAATRVFGWADHEVLGASLDVIVPEEHRRTHWGAFFRAVSTGLSPEGHQPRELSAVHRDGHVIPIALALSPIRVEGSDRLAGVAAVVRYGTEGHRV